MRAWVQVAELAKAKTLSGGLVARPVHGLPFLLSEGLEVAFVPPQHDAPRHSVVKSVQDEGKGSYRVMFEDVTSIDIAERLSGCRCLVRRESLPIDALVVFENELIGWGVYDANAGFIGTIGDVIENPGQTLLEVIASKGYAAGDTQDDQRVILIPLVEAFIEGFDEDEACLNVNLPDGLLDL